MCRLMKYPSQAIGYVGKGQFMVLLTTDVEKIDIATRGLFSVIVSDFQSVSFIFFRNLNPTIFPQNLHSGEFSELNLFSRVFLCWCLSHRSTSGKLWASSGSLQSFYSTSLYSPQSSSTTQSRNWIRREDPCSTRSRRLSQTQFSR